MSNKRISPVTLPRSWSIRFSPRMPCIRSPSIFENPSTYEKDNVISLRVKSIGLFAHSLRPAGIRALRGGPPDALSSRNRGNEVRIMIDLSERRATYDYETT